MFLIMRQSEVTEKGKGSLAEDIPFLMSVAMTRGFGRLVNWSELLGKEHLTIWYNADLF